VHGLLSVLTPLTDNRSEAVTRFATLLQLTDDMLVRAERGDLEDCVRILAAHCDHYRSIVWAAPNGRNAGSSFERNYER
jgi:hypothetical protein